MDKSCSTCQEILAYEQALDQRANTLVERVNSLCADVRMRNKDRWEKFAHYVNHPIIGNLIYEFFRTPKGLEPDPRYFDSDWYRQEGCLIEERAKSLEKMKSGHMEHWGDERVNASFPWDYAGYYEHCHPKNPMLRRDAYIAYTVWSNTSSVVEGEDKLIVFVPEKYDFSSAAGVDKMQEGIFVLDSVSKKVVPVNQCNSHWRALKDTASNLRERLIARFARSGTVYTLRKA